MFLIYFIVVPVISVVIYGIGSEDSVFFSMSGLKRSFEYLFRSLKISVPVTLIATTMGMILSFTLNRIEFSGRRAMRIIALLPFVNPPFVGSISFIMLFGKRGLITHKMLGLTVSPFGPVGIITIQILGLSSLAYILISSSVNKVDTTLEDAARNLGASEGDIFRTVTFPLMIPEISSTSLLVFLASMSDFSTPLIIGGNFQTLASDLYIQITGLYDMETAAISGIILLIPCFGAFVLQKYYISRQSYFTDDSMSLDIRYKNMGRKTKGFLIGFCGFFLFIVFTKYFFIIIGAFTKQWGHDYTLTLDHFEVLFTNRYKPFINSVKLATTSAFIASLSGVLLAYLIRMKKMYKSFAADFMATLPAAVPGILFGIGYLVTFKYPLFGIGRYIFTDHKPLLLLGTGIIIYIICIARFMNTGLRSGYALLEHVHPDLEKASYNLGASEFAAFAGIIFPLMKDAFFASFLKSFSSGMVTLGAIIFLLLPSNKVAVQQIFQIITGNMMGTAAAMALFLSVLTLTLLGLFYLIFYYDDLVKKHKKHTVERRAG